MEDTVPDVSSRARTNEILCKSWEERNQRLTSGWSAGPRALFVPGCWTVYRRLFVFVNPFHARHVREKPLGSKTRTYHNPNIPRADRVGANGRVAWQCRAGLLPAESFLWGKKSPLLHPHNIEDNSFERFLRRTIKQKPM